MVIRNATMEDLEQLVSLEAACFPAEEAATKEALEKRLTTFPDCFWLLEERGVIITMVNGMASNYSVLFDEMYTNANLHEKDGSWLMILAVDTLPVYRKIGCAEKVLRYVIAEASAQGRKGIVLTCKEELIPYYKKLGFINEGKSNSKHGGAVWYDMRLMLTDEYSTDTSRYEYNIRHK